MAAGAHDLRQGFLQYFVENGHTAVPSASLIPQADPTLLFTNAGMNQFKRVFLGEETRSYRRAASSQKCVRAGGKHNDLENVGYTARHHTFFEMLGNFSFGDYFKEEAIQFAWTYLTKVVGLPKDRLWATVFREDDEAFALWKNIGMPESRLQRFDEKDNFWQMGETGPCGPCSEIHFDQGPSVQGDAVPNGGGDRVLEIWNLVFMQYNKDEGGTRRNLPKPSIDTGMGLERLAAVVQGKTSNYDTDLFQPILRAIEERCGKRYGASLEDDRAFRVIADHLRAITFMVADGILPSNEGRGYVLRRILRRAGRYGKLLGLGREGPFLCGLTESVISVMKGAYPELKQAGATVHQVTEAEEDRFLDTLEKGEPMLASAIAAALQSKQKTIPGDKLFELYDTYGYPLDLAADSAREKGLVLDMDGYQAALAAQRERARKGAGFEQEKIKPVVAELAGRLAPTQFVGYDRLQAESVVQAILKGDRLVKEAVEGDEVELALDVTPFYAEGGGQVGDQGLLIGPEGRVEIQETTKPAPNVFLHKGVVRTGRVREGDPLESSVNSTARKDAARNHTATHLVHAALREILGPHVKQYGSLVAPNRLRFDFAHFRPLSSRDIDDVEGVVNDRVRRNDAVRTAVMGTQEAVQAGALAFFGDKYGDKVRVVSINSFSKELCGGTHCVHTGEIGVFRLVSETGIAAGVRRLEALTGYGAMTHIKQLERDVQALSELLKVGPAEIVGKTKKLVAQLKEKERELEQVKLRLATGAATESQVRTIGGIQVHVQRADGMDGSELRALADRVRDKQKSGVIALGGVKEGKVSLILVVTKDLVSRLRAGDLIRDVAAEVGGTGGGRPEMAQAGGKDPERVDAALQKVFALVEKAVGP